MPGRLKLLETHTLPHIIQTINITILINRLVALVSEEQLRLGFNKFEHSLQLNQSLPCNGFNFINKEENCCIGQFKVAAINNGTALLHVTCIQHD